MRLPSAGDSKRRWLAFDLLGCISSRLEEGQSVIEVAFHDAASHKRMPLFSDFRDFCMASLGPKVLCGQRVLLHCSCCTSTANESAHTVAGRALRECSCTALAVHANIPTFPELGRQRGMDAAAACPGERHVRCSRGQLLRGRHV